MTENDIITRLVDLHDHIQAPATAPRLDALRGERLVRRRRMVSVAAAAAALVLTLGIVQVSLSDPLGIQEPASPPSKGEQWTPDRIRAEGSLGDPQGAIATTASGLTTLLYQVCDGPSCDYLDGPPEDLHVALEVGQAGRSAVFDFHFTPQPWVRAFDEDSVLVQDAEYGTPPGPVRFRLLDADGTAVELRLLDDPAPPVPAPGVIVIDSYNSILAGSEEPYLVDDRAGTLRPLAVPEDVRYWGPNADEFLWGVTDDCRVFWATRGAFDEDRLDCSDSLDFTYGIAADDFPPGWLRPGSMALAEQSDPGNVSFVHVSLDGGGSWQRVRVGADEIVADALERIG